MRIGIVSDSHGHQANVSAALEMLADRGVSIILHCGDIDDAATVRLFAGIPTNFVLGNCDVDLTEIKEAAESSGGFFHGRFAELVLAGRRIAVVHGDDPARFQAAIGSGDYDYVFFGHTHEAGERQVGKTWVINPGALFRAKPKTAVVLDLESGEREWLRVAE
jgi:putative phosphoesterase